VIEEEIRSTHPFAVFQLRSMLAVSYFEKAMYELPEDQVTAEMLLALADEIELKIQGGLSPRPLLSVPHLISDEASCYYQGYTVSIINDFKIIYSRPTSFSNICIFAFCAFWGFYMKAR
jgi:hypothetical protein